MHPVLRGQAIREMNGVASWCSTWVGRTSGPPCWTCAGMAPSELLKSDAFRRSWRQPPAPWDDLFLPVARAIRRGDAGLGGVDYTLGFIFAFPNGTDRDCEADASSKWTKEFAFSGVEGQDVVRLLEDAIVPRVLCGTRPAQAEGRRSCQ